LDATLLTIGALLIFLGFVIAVSAILLTILRQPKGRREIKGGGVIFIGPIPIIFGTDKKMIGVALVSALIILLIAVFFYFTS